MSDERQASDEKCLFLNELLLLLLEAIMLTPTRADPDLQQFCEVTVSPPTMDKSRLVMAWLDSSGDADRSDQEMKENAKSVQSSFSRPDGCSKNSGS
jgi:hypothetical protein